MIDVLHHMTYPEEMLQDIRKILKPGGLLYFEEPIAEKTGKVGGMEKMRYSRVDFILLVEKNGFKYKEDNLLEGRTFIFTFEVIP